jgi:hypothetical protein
MATSYNGWPASKDPDVIGVNRTWEPLPGVRFPGGIKSGDVEVIFTYLIIQLNNRVERADLYQAGDDWGYAFRANVNNPNPQDDNMSCHASATAIDYNATRHPNRVKYTWTWPQVAEIRKIVDYELEGVIRWLHGYDEMHFEIRGSAARVKAVADKIRNLEDLMTPEQYDEIMSKLTAIELRIIEFDDDVPENMKAKTEEIQRNVRRIGQHAGVPNIEGTAT